MPRSRVPSVWPSIQLFLRAATASLEVSMIMSLIVLATRKVFHLSLFISACFTLILDLSEILGLSSTSRRIPRIGPAIGLLEVVAVGICAFAYAIITFVVYLGSPTIDRNIWGPLTGYCMIAVVISGVMHFIFLIFNFVDCCYLVAKRKRATEPEFHELEPLYEEEPEPPRSK